MRRGTGAGLRGLLGARLPDDPVTGRPVLPRWPFPVVAVGALVLAVGLALADGSGWVSLPPVLGGAAAAVVAAVRPVTAAIVAVVSVLAATALAAVVRTGEVAPPWFADVAPPHLVVAWAVGAAVPVVVAARVLGALVLSGLAFSLLAVPPELWPGWGAPVAWAALVALAGAVGARRRDRHLRTERLLAEAGERRLREEHDRIARELHDSVAHHLSELALRAASAPRRLAGVGEESAAEFGALGGLARSALGEMRQLLGVLRGDAPGERVPQPGLGEVVELTGSARRAGLEVELELAEPPGLAAGTALSAYRIVQEALSNAVRHAPGARTTVRVGQRGEVLRVEVENGPAATPAPPAPGAGLGLVGMRERARVLGGWLDAGPRPDGGFTVRAELPVGPA